MKVGRLLLLLVLPACLHRTTLELGPLLDVVAFALPADSAALEALRHAHPCPAALPPLYSRVDSLAADARCTLIATAVATIRDSIAAPGLRPDLRAFRLDRVACVDVRAEAYRDPATGAIEEATWIVELLSDEQSPLLVTVDRQTGAARAYRALNEFGFSARQICDRAP